MSTWFSQVVFYPMKRSSYGISAHYLFNTGGAYLGRTSWTRRKAVLITVEEHTNIKAYTHEINWQYVLYPSFVDSYEPSVQI